MENLPDDIKKAEARGYSKGYQAGKLRRHAEATAERRHRERQAFWQRAFLAALPSCITAQGWKSGEEPTSGVTQRTNLAKSFADEATKIAYGA